MAFGRLNPITVGHEKLVNKVLDTAKKVGGTAHIVVSHSQDPKKNPLTAAQKLKHAKRAFPDVHVSASDKDSPNFLSQASKLHKQGVTHFHMIGGQDRVDEYHKLLHKYNGVKGAHGHFNFKHIQVHSAGDRDPDAEGVEGMSASKMREHAASGNFKEFRKGVPSKMTDAHAKEMYHDVRKGMQIKESLDDLVEDLLTEGVHDKAIFKAVFLGGGPGSGKDFVLSKTLDGHGLTEINSDKALEFLMDKNNLDMKMPESEKEARDVVRSKAKTMTELRQKLALLGRNGLIINGTGDNSDKIKKIKDRLEELGYETSMIMVNTRDEVSAQRNVERGQRGGRTVPEEIRKEKWQSVQDARPELAAMFGVNYAEVDNSEDLRTAPPEVRQAKEQELLDLYKRTQSFISKPPKNDISKEWIANEMQKKDTLPVPTTETNVQPHPDSSAAAKAREMGLTYYGFGRYGTRGKVTHRSVHDKLVQVNKNINEDFEEFLKDDLESLEEMTNKKKAPNYVKDGKGNVRVFKLRAIAAKDAHVNNGTVLPYKNGYVVKINEENKNELTTIFEEPILEQSSSGTKTSGQEFGRTASSEIGTVSTKSYSAGTRTSYGTCSEGRTSADTETFTEENKKRTITLAEIRAKQKDKKVNESIDKGTEPGVSMAGSGESIGRDTGEKIRKKDGKASVVEGRHGLSLSTFKSKRTQ